MRIAEYVPGEVLVLEVTSRSRGREILHHLALHLKRDGQVADVSCSCEGFLLPGRLPPPPQPPGHGRGPRQEEGEERDVRMGGGLARWARG